MRIKGGGAQGRNRTTDTAIFSRMLYQLSYLGAEPLRRLTGRVYRQWLAACPVLFRQGFPSDHSSVRLTVSAAPSR